MHMSMSYARRSLALLTAALLATLALLALSSVNEHASASPYPPTTPCTVSTSDKTVNPGDTIQVNGSGFPANTLIQLSLHSTPVPLNSVHSDANGAFTDTITIPSSVTGTNHVITASSPSTTCMFDPFSPNSQKGVDAVATTHQAATKGVDGLASTGFATLTASVIAVALLAGGGLLILLGRRRSKS